ncbi:SDR family oxidoreductase [Acanthopleuribacter pedis]|uniref:SDR family oxidoreductase n=1 Tax=Acanthopleuribacter pedis TaxID=442870 RepID=A0A8J7U573_9BACT|nr:SDR family oxidoreductase [Acanthopleuribacter pedis]MBO1322233.1 SDR family oxidoreductase [Acanthopleuribacter pedis]
MNGALSGKRALVCGASQGIGAAIAAALADMGCAVTALARTQEKLEAVVTALPGDGHRVVALDIGDWNALNTAISLELAEGDIQILINNSGGPAPGPISQAPAEAFSAGLQNHIIAANGLTQLLLPGMKRAGYGRIINIISTSVKIPIPNLGVSNTIRGAMASWAKTLSLEVAADGITVNNILPGFTQTPRLDKLIAATATRLGKSEDEVAQMWRERVPARRFGDPKETAAAAAFLASPAAGYINGVNLPVDGGRTGCL